MARSIIATHFQNHRSRKDNPAAYVHDNPQTGFYDQGYHPASLAEGSDGFLFGVNSAGEGCSGSFGSQW